jgi:8-oxo-dGTP pyrophosphatase MutT (NUDIX family)
MRLEFAESYQGKNGTTYTEAQARHFVSIHRGFREWTKKIKPLIKSDVRILHIYPFVDTNNPIGFIMAEYDGYFVLIRGETVGVLVILVAEEDQKKYVLFVKQRRLGVADEGSEEIVSGMSVRPVSSREAALQELQEEAGIHATAPELTFLGKMHATAGICDETVHIYQIIKMMPRAEILAMQGVKKGLAAEHEDITLSIRSLDEARRLVKRGVLKDSKITFALLHHDLRPSVRKTRRRKHKD